MLEALNKIPADPLLKLIGEFASDTRSNKVDVGVGVYRNAEGHTDVMKAVKMAEQRLVDEQPTKSYVGMAGDIAFVEELRKLTFGENFGNQSRLTGLQTPGGSGALRLAGDLIFRSNPEAKLWVGLPCWSNHIPIFEAAGLQVGTYKRFDIDRAEIDFNSVALSLALACTGDIILLQGCCHNPTGADFSVDEWEAIGDLCNKRGLIPLVDFAYQGLGQSLEADVLVLETLLKYVPEAFVTVSCSKNFGLYRERTGALFILAANQVQAEISRTNLFALARTNYSMPPDHGASIVRMILQNPELKTVWQQELNEMRERITAMRVALSTILMTVDPQYEFITRQQGMFSILPLTSGQIEALKIEHGIYMAGNGRINLAGLNKKSVINFGTGFKLLCHTTTLD